MSATPVPPTSPRSDRRLKSILVNPGVIMTPISPASSTATTPDTPHAHSPIAPNPYAPYGIPRPVTPPRPSAHSAPYRQAEAHSPPVSPSKVRFAPLPASRREERARATDECVPWAAAPRTPPRGAFPPPPPPPLPVAAPTSPRSSQAYRLLREKYLSDLARTGAIGEEDLPGEDEDTFEIRQRVRGY